MDFPTFSAAPPNICSFSPYSGMNAMLTIHGTASAGVSAVWPAANRALYIPIAIPAPFLLSAFFCLNGATVNGNIDMGLLSPEGSLILSKGSTAQAGTSTLQILTVGPQLIMPGRYFMALSCSSGTATFISRASGNQVLQPMGILQAATQLPLATLPTFATPASSYMPWIGISQRAVF